MVEQTKDTVPGGFCLAPLSAYIPTDLWCHLPDWFLSSALLDSYETERRLLETFPDKYANTFVKPSAGSTQPISYHSCSAVVRSIQQRVSPAIFSTMVDWGIVAAMEDLNDVDIRLWTPENSEMYARQQCL